jgi:pimeloyl-ACP methyl ester carboxylesterase
VYGDADVRSRLDIAEDLHANIPGSRLAALPGVGHLCDMEASECFNAEVRAFLRAAG